MKTYDLLQSFQVTNLQGKVTMVFRPQDNLNKKESALQVLKIFLWENHFLKASGKKSKLTYARSQQLEANGKHSTIHSHWKQWEDSHFLLSI